MQRVTGTDAAFLEMETPAMHLHVVGVLILDPTGTANGFTPERLEALFRNRLHLIPPFRQRVVSVPGGLDHPRWIEDPSFDLSRHLHHRTLGPKATQADLEAFVGEVAGVPLDRDRPLWASWLVDGFADGSVALVTKVHHAVMDGAAGGDLMASLFDLDPDADTDVVDEPPAWTGEPVPHPARLVAEAGPGALARLARLPGVLARTATSVARSARAMAGRERSPVQVAPGTPFNGPLTPARSVAFAHGPLDDLKEIRRAFGTTINDVVLAATTNSLRRYLLDHDATASQPLVASVPVALPRRDDEAFGNQTTTILVSLPVHLDDPVEALRSIHHDALGAKAVQQALGPDVLEDWAGLAPAALLTAGARLYSDLGLGRLHPPFFNTIVSNVPGPPIPLYLAGARVVATYPMGPLIANAGLNLTVLSQTGELDVGVIACPDLVDDVRAVADGFLAGVAELLKAARDQAAAPPVMQSAE
jgi:diacylglycerol O-acyltransferase / wax synthase